MSDLTFSAAKSAAYANFMPGQIVNLHYVEHLAMQTGQSVDNWDTTPFLKVPAGDKKALNKLFFSNSQEKQDAPKTLDPSLLESIQKLAVLRLESTREIRKRDLKATIQRYVSEVNDYSDGMNRKMAEALKFRDQLALIDNVDTHSQIPKRIEKILQSNFWDFKGLNGPKLEMITRNNIILSEVNAEAGINRRVDMGKYLARLNFEFGSITVHAHESNVLRESYYHPYVKYNGDICWGNAKETVTKKILENAWDDVFSLLEALLTTYSPSATPYIRLHEFAEGPPEQEDLCDECDEPIDDCECFVCEYCDHRSPDSTCEEHWCSICSESSRYRECCCQSCERSNDDCVCCSICGENQEECGCCQECDRRDSRCTRCRECNNHDGHETNCTTNVQEREIEF